MVLDITSPKIKVSAGLCFFLESLAKNMFPCLVFIGCLHCLAYDSVLQLQSQQCCIFQTFFFDPYTSLLKGPI